MAMDFWSVRLLGQNLCMLGPSRFNISCYTWRPLCLARHFVFPHVLSLHIDVIFTYACPNSIFLTRCSRMLVLMRSLQRIALIRFQWYYMHPVLYFLSLNYLGSNRIGFLVYCSLSRCCRRNWILLKRIKMPSLKSFLKCVLYICSLFP